MNKYPIYVISKGRANLKAHTARFLIKDKVEFKIVIEPQEQNDYAEKFGKERLLILPFSNLGQGSIPARNWIWEHAINGKYKKHWIIDDNIDGVVTWVKGKRKKCNSLLAFKAVENFTDKFENVALSGLNYRFFAPANMKPYYLNCHVYSCILIKNDLDFRWRGRYNEDTDLCLQALTRNYCTLGINTYLTNKAKTMSCKGGNMIELYQGNGRLKMSRSLEYSWLKYPGMVKTTIKWGRPQHHVKWKIFKTRLKLSKKT